MIGATVTWKFFSNLIKNLPTFVVLYLIQQDKISDVCTTSATYRCSDTGIVQVVCSLSSLKTIHDHFITQNPDPINPLYISHHFYPKSPLCFVPTHHHPTIKCYIYNPHFYPARPLICESVNSFEKKKKRKQKQVKNYHHSLSTPLFCKRDWENRNRFLNKNRSCFQIFSLWISFTAPHISPQENGKQVPPKTLILLFSPWKYETHIQPPLIPPSKGPKGDYSSIPPPSHFSFSSLPPSFSVSVA